MDDLESKVFGKDSRITVFRGNFGLRRSLIKGGRTANLYIGIYEIDI